MIGSRRDILKTVAGVSTTTLLDTIPLGLDSEDRVFEYEFEVHPSEWGELDRDTVVELYYNMDARTVQQSLCRRFSVAYIEDGERKFRRGTGVGIHKQSDKTEYDYVTPLAVPHTGIFNAHPQPDNYTIEVPLTDWTDPQLNDIALKHRYPASMFKNTGIEKVYTETGSDQIYSILSDLSVFNTNNTTQASRPFFEFKLDTPIQELESGDTLTVYYNTDSISVYNLFTGAVQFVRDSDIYVLSLNLFNQSSNHPEYEYQATTEVIPDLFTDIETENLEIELTSINWDQFISSPFGSYRQRDLIPYSQSGLIQK
jgi:hypothetical protein